MPLAIEEAVDIWRESRESRPFIKGRVALYAILRALNLGSGDAVVVPGFTCFVVPAAITYTGATPRYYDIDPVSLQGSPESAMQACNSTTQAVLIQHNFGTPAESNELLRFCRDRDIAVIEDCAHAIGARYRSTPVGHLGDAAFTSLQWSKSTTTGLGGIALSESPVIQNRLDQVIDGEFSDPSSWKSLYLLVLSWLYREFYRPDWYWTLRDLYHRAARIGLLQGSSLSQEFCNSHMPRSYRETFGPLRAKTIGAALSSLPDAIMHRRRTFSRYTEHFRRLDTWTPPDEHPDDFNTSLRYPVLVENRSELLRAAASESVELGDWFNAPLHPRECAAEAFGYDPGLCPVAEAASKRIVNLPTHGHVDEEELERVLSFMDRFADLTSLDSWNRSAHHATAGVPTSPC